jgi:hypothetical protein
MAGFQQRIYLVSLFPGKLSVAHWCASLTWRLKSTLGYRSLPSIRQSQSCTSQLNPPFVSEAEGLQMIDDKCQMIYDR